MSVHIEISEEAARFILGILLTRSHWSHTSNDQRDLLYHAIDALRVGLQISTVRALIPRVVHSLGEQEAVERARYKA